MGGVGVKISEKTDHVVYGWPLTPRNFNWNENIIINPETKILAQDLVAFSTVHTILPTLLTTRRIPNRRRHNKSEVQSIETALHWTL